MPLMYDPLTPILAPSSDWVKRSRWRLRLTTSPMRSLSVGIDFSHSCYKRRRTEMTKLLECFVRPSSFVLRRSGFAGQAVARGDDLGNDADGDLFGCVGANLEADR